MQCHTCIPGIQLGRASYLESIMFGDWLEHCLHALSVCLHASQAVYNAG